MSDAYHDGSGVHTLIAVETDGVTLVNVKANPSTHALDVSDGTTGVDNGPSNSRHDGSHVPVLIATSSSDGKTPVVVYSDSGGSLLVDSF